MPISLYFPRAGTDATEDAPEPVWALLDAVEALSRDAESWHR
jgi:hypothetical protein